MIDANECLMKKKKLAWDEVYSEQLAEAVTVESAV